VNLRRPEEAIPAATGGVLIKGVMTMTKLTKLTVAVLAAATISAVVCAQSGSRTRGLMIKNYETGKTDGMRVLIYKVDNNLLVPVDPARTFTKGDDIKVAFESNFDGYVYFINVSPKGKTKVLFPFAGESNNAVKPRQRYELPTTGVISFDEEKGVEILQVVMSRSRVAVLDDAIKNANGELGDSAASAAAELASNGKTKTGLVAANVAVAIPASGGSVRTRGIKLAPGRDKDEKGSIVSVPDTKSSDGRLKGSEVAVFEIRLKHT
jgi:hypothetical protein